MTWQCSANDKVRKISKCQRVAKRRDATCKAKNSCHEWGKEGRNFWFRESTKGVRQAHWGI